MEQKLDLGNELLTILEPEQDLAKELQQSIEGLDPLKKDAAISKFSKQHGIRKAAIDRYLKPKTPKFSAVFDGLVDIVKNNDELMFLVLDDNGSLNAVESITIEEDTKPGSSRIFLPEIKSDPTKLIPINGNKG